MQALALWGVDALARLAACLRLAAFDRESGQLILAADAFGEKPLYYAELAGGGLAFASELQALEAVPNVGLQVSFDAVAELLMFQYIGAPRTIYSSVSKLPPAHWLIAYPGQAPKIGKYFEFRPGSTGFDHRPLKNGGRARGNSGTKPAPPLGFRRSAWSVFVGRRRFLDCLRADSPPS